MNATTSPSPTPPIQSDIERYLRAHEQKSLLRLIACGSVDDGKSTLIGRLLYESRALLDDQLAALDADSKKYGTQGDEPDFALLVDGLAAEREQGITIDVAYRFFSTDKRKFILADAPGHEQYTRNMITGASTADLAVVLVDARKGVTTQTHRHTCLAWLLGIRHVVLAVNKLDLVDWSRPVFERIEAQFRAFLARLDGGIEHLQCIPLSALRGDNLTQPSANTPWYSGPPLLRYLEEVEISPPSGSDGPFRMPVQWVNRPNPEFRGFAGRVLGGGIRPGDAVRVLPSGRVSRVARIVGFDGDREQAVAGESAMLTLADEIDASRGDVFCAADDPAGVADQFEATVAWMGDEALLPGRACLAKLGASTVGATLSRPKYALDVNTLDHLPARTLQSNQIGVCTLTLDRAVPFDSYAHNRDMGSFILIDRHGHQTVGAGMLHFALRRSQNIHWQALEIDQTARARLNGHKSAVLWLTGLSGSGKSTIGNLLERRLHALGAHTYLLDGDNVRHGLNKDLGFTAADRVENIRRVGEVARLMADAGLIVVTAFISPFRAEREMARRMMRDGEFVEIFIDTPLAVAEQRDPKGLYKKARRGELVNFTGIDSPYETPLAPELRIDTTRLDAETAAERIVAYLRAQGLLPIGT